MWHVGMSHVLQPKLQMHCSPLNHFVNSICGLDTFKWMYMNAQKKIIHIIYSITVKSLHSIKTLFNNNPKFNHIGSLKSAIIIMTYCFLILN